MVRCLLDAPFGVEKLRTIKTARFCGRVLFGYKPFWFISKKLFETKTLVLVFKVDFNPKPRFGVEKLKSFCRVRGKHKTNSQIN
jgi:hypothetical protein